MLSGGEQQRLALARAWALEPKVLFLDEPTANLDPAATRAIEAVIAAMHERGVKIVMTTHDLGQARRHADEIVFLHRGRLDRARRRGPLLRAPAHARGPDLRRRRAARCKRTTTKGDEAMHRRSILLGALLAAGLGLTARARLLAQDQFITVASTTSTENSGLFGELLPKFQEETGIEVRVVAVGTGQAIKLARERRRRRAVRAPQAVRGAVRRPTASGSSATRSCTTTS